MAVIFCNRRAPKMLKNIYAKCTICQVAKWCTYLHNITNCIKCQYQRYEKLVFIFFFKLQSTQQYGIIELRDNARIPQKRAESENDMKTMTIIFEKTVNDKTIHEMVKPLNIHKETTIKVYEAAGWKVWKTLG